MSSFPSAWVSSQVDTAIISAAHKDGPIMGDDIYPGLQVVTGLTCVAVSLDEYHSMVESPITIEIEAENCLGHRHRAFGTNWTLEQAIADALQEITDLTGDRTYRLIEYWHMI